MLGADGYNSNVREYLNVGRTLAQHAGSLIINGFVKSNISPEIPREISDNEPITESKLKKICPQGRVNTIFGDNVSFGSWTMGNGMVGWNMIVRQPKPRYFVDYFEQLKRNTSKLGGNTNIFENKIETDAQSPAWLVSTPKDSANVQKNVIFNSTVTPTPHTKTLAEDPGTLSKSEIIQMALHFASTEFDKDVISLIKATDANSVSITDNSDLVDQPPECYTAPNFYPGRVILIGDAAHPIATAPHGSVGASLALCDAVVLAKLIHYSFSAEGSQKILSESKSDNPTNSILAYVGLTFDKMRFDPCNLHMNEARNVCTWKKHKPGVWKSLSATFGIGTSWERLQFKDMQDLGGILLPEDLK